LVGAFQNLQLFIIQGKLTKITYANTILTEISESLRIPPQSPPDFNLCTSGILEETKLMLKKTRYFQDEIAQITYENATFANIVLPQTYIEAENECRLGVFRCFLGASYDKQYQETLKEIERMDNDFAVESQLRKDLFVLVDAVFRRAEPLDPESQYLLERKHNEYRRNGMGLAGPERARFA